MVEMIRGRMSSDYVCASQIIAHDALKALVNLSDTLMVARNLVDEEFLTFLISYTAVSHP